MSCTITTMINNTVIFSYSRVKKRNVSFKRTIMRVTQQQGWRREEGERERESSEIS